MGSGIQGPGFEVWGQEGARLWDIWLPFERYGQGGKAPKEGRALCQGRECAYHAITVFCELKIKVFGLWDLPRGARRAAVLPVRTWWCQATPPSPMVLGQTSRTARQGGQMLCRESREANGGLAEGLPHLLGHREL